MDNRDASGAEVVPPPELVDFVKRHIRNTFIDRSAGRRSSTEVDLVPALVQPIDAHFRAVGEPFPGIAHDRSSADVELVYDQPFEGRLVALKMRLGGEDIIAVAEVQWNKNLGPYYNVGANFVATLDHFPNPQEGTWFLTNDANASGTLHYAPVDSSPFIVGRRRGLSLRLSNATVSGRHAELFVRDGALFVRDLGSTNGTFVNGEPIGDEHRLEEGDLLQLGDVTMGIYRQIHVAGRYGASDRGNADVAAAG